MLGLKPELLEKIKKSGKLIEGAGTGTSDDIKLAVPKGSYIVPADTTAALGLGGLKTQEHIPFAFEKEIKANEPLEMAGLNNINISHGEYVIPPEGVARLGLSNLDAIRAATHTPVHRPKQEAFFADGGLTDEELRRRNQQTTGGDVARAYGLGGLASLGGLANTVTKNPAIYSPRTLETFNRVASGASRAGNAGAALALGAGVAGGLGTDHQQYRDRFGLGQEDYSQNPVVGGLKAAGVQLAGAASDVANTMGLGLPSKLLAGMGIGYLDKNMAKWNNPPSASDTKAKGAATNQNATTVANPFATKPAPTSWADNPEIQAIPAKGKSTSPTSADKQVMSSAQLDALAPTLPKGVQQLETMDYKDPSQTELAMRALQNVGQGIEQARVNTPIAPTRGYDERMQREKLIRQLSTVQNGARGLTAAQMRGLQELVQGEDSIAQNAYNQQMQFAQAQLREREAMQRAMLGEQGSNARAIMNEAGTNERYNKGFGLDMAKFNQQSAMEEAQLGLDKERLAKDTASDNIKNYMQNRLVRLQTQYDNAKTDQERQAIMDKANATLGNGKGTGSTKDDFISVDAGIDADGNDLGRLLYNVKTGEFINPREKAQLSNSDVQVGQVVKGYRFKGGDPADEKNWEKV